MSEIKPRQARALADLLARKRCPKCNAYGKMQANRSLVAACMHCGIGILFSDVTFSLVTAAGGQKWKASIGKIEVKVQ